MANVTDAPGKTTADVPSGTVITRGWKTMADVIKLPTYNVNMGDAVVIVKRCINDESIPHETKLLAIEKVANMETHNSITKDDLVKCLRWMFEHYDF